MKELLMVIKVQIGKHIQHFNSLKLIPTSTCNFDLNFLIQYMNEVFYKDKNNSRKTKSRQKLFWIANTKRVFLSKDYIRYRPETRLTSA